MQISREEFIRGITEMQTELKDRRNNVEKLGHYLRQGSLINASGEMAFPCVLSTIVAGKFPGIKFGKSDSNGDIKVVKLPPGITMQEITEWYSKFKPSTNVEELDFNYAAFHPLYGFRRVYHVLQIILDLSLQHKWSYEQIADWLEQQGL